jgi:hypothetical protein
MQNYLPDIISATNQRKLSQRGQLVGTTLITSSRDIEISWSVLSGNYKTINRFLHCQLTFDLNIICCGKPTKMIDTFEFKIRDKLNRFHFANIYFALECINIKCMYTCLVHTLSSRNHI